MHWVFCSKKPFKKLDKYYFMKKLELNQMNSLEGGSWGCAWSSIGLGAAVVGFAFVTGGASLAVALVGYAAGVGGVSTSC